MPESWKVPVPPRAETTFSVPVKVEPVLTPTGAAVIGSTQFGAGKLEPESLCRFGNLGVFGRKE